MTSSRTRKEKAAKDRALRRADTEVPILDFPYDSASLRFGGPIIITNLTITDDHRKALLAAGQKVPDPVSCRFLIDTGADACVVKHEIAERAGLKLINASAPLHGIGIDTSGRTYVGRVLFTLPSKKSPGVVINIFVDTQIASGGLTLTSIDGVIGRDVLQHFEMTYNGKTGNVRLRYFRPQP